MEKHKMKKKHEIKKTKRKIRGYEKKGNEKKSVNK
jgi:hypothetical protein